MSSVGIFYGSNGGATESLAYDISEELIRSGFKVEIMDIAEVSLKEVEAFDNIIIGTSTMGMRVLQDDWEDVLDRISNMSFEGKNVALFGTGNQEIYPDTFADGLGVLFDLIRNSDANLVGQWSTDGYKFRESNAVVDKKFVGLVLDDETQHNHNKARIKDWVKQLTVSFN